MRRKKDVVYETTVYTNESNYPEVEYYRLLGDLGRVSVSDALRRSLFAVHPDTKDYFVTILTGRDLAKAKTNTELNNLVRNVVPVIHLDGTEPTQPLLSVQMSNYDLLHRLQDPEDAYFKNFREICGDEEFNEFKQKIIQNMMISSPVTAMRFAIGRIAAIHEMNSKTRYASF